MKSAVANDNQSDNFLKDSLFKCRRAFMYVGLFSFATNFLMLMLPIYSLQVLDRVFSSHSGETLIMLTVIAVIVFSFYGIFQLVRSIVLSRIGEWLEKELSPRLLSLAVSRASLGANNSGGQVLRDLSSVKNFISGAGITSLFDAPWSIIFILVTYMISPVLGFINVFGALLLVGFAWMTEISTKKPLDLANKLSITNLSYADLASRNAEAIDAMGMTNAVVNSWEERNHRSLELQDTVNTRNNTILTISRIVRILLQIAMTGVGAWLALNGELTTGGMIACSTLAGRALAPFESAISIWKTVVSTRDAYNRLNSVVTTTPKLRGTMTLPAPSGLVVVENIYFQPPGSQRSILKNVSLRLNPGESLGIIGPSAAGKSTLAKLLLGINAPSHGTIRLDHFEIHKWNRENIGPHIGYLPQDVDLFWGTIKDNIARMDLDADPEKVIEAAKRAGVHELILHLPKGYDTEVGPGHQSLSPGQRQRVGLARALYGDPRLVVLDEPNSNLDADGERALMTSMNLLREHKITAVIVAHRPSIVANVDKILMLRDGAVEQFGPRDQVLQRYVQPSAVPSIAQNNPNKSA